MIHRIIIMNTFVRRLSTGVPRPFLNSCKTRNTFLENPPNPQILLSRKLNGSNSVKVTILGAGGKIGKSVSLLLKQSPFIDELCLYDNKSLAGFAHDLNFVDTKCNVTSYFGLKDIKHALSKSSVVVVLTTAPQTTGLDYNALFEKNAVMVKELAINIARFSPKSLVAIGTEPINSIVPMFSEIMRKHGSYNPNGIFGITTIDVVRTNRFVADTMGIEPECVMVPVVGGHSEKTIVPVLSKATPCNEFTNEELEDITNCVRGANDNLQKIRSCDGAYLSNAFATARFVLSLVKAVRGWGDIVEGAYVKSTAHPQLKYMVTPLVLGQGGVQKNLGVPELSDYEFCLLENAIPILVEDIKKGESVGGRPMNVVKGKLEDKPICDPCDPNPNAPRCPPDHCELQSMIAGDKR